MQPLGLHAAAHRKLRQEAAGERDRKEEKKAEGNGASKALRKLVGFFLHDVFLSVFG